MGLLPILCFLPPRGLSWALEAPGRRRGFWLWLCEKVDELFGDGQQALEAVIERRGSRGSVAAGAADGGEDFVADPAIEALRSMMARWKIVRRERA